ncbi:MAG: class I SAM-dependent methyltransferase [Candidatus Odinarchaeota archaeon]
MVRKNPLPKFPEDYLSEKAEEYNNSKWMKRNQNKTTLKTIEYLYDRRLDSDTKDFIISRDSHLILDLGCGTGFSSEILIQNGFRVIGIDILNDMLLKAREKKKIIKNYNNLELILADINHLPFKMNTIDFIISISSYNFITYGLEKYGEKVKLLNDTAQYLHRILKKNGRIIIEFYPQNENELKMFNNSFINNNFEGYMVKSNPNQKSGQTFLLLKKKM